MRTCSASWLIGPLAVSLSLNDTVQAQIQGASGVCAVPINVLSLPFATTTTILQGTPAMGSSVCGFSSSDQGHAYSITGTGKILQAQVSWKSTDSGTLGLFTGVDCTACNSNQALNAILLSSPLIWQGQVGATYTLVVAGELFYGSSIGYSLEITEFQGAPNDSCDSAVPANNLPFSATGDNTGAFPDFDTQTCYVSPTVRGVWYHFMGGGKVTRISVTRGKFNLRIAVFKGSCADLFCDGSSVGSGSAEMDFLGYDGVEYFILVTGYNSDSDVGTFTIDITELELPSNYQCDSAEAIDNLPTSISGDTTGAISGHYDTECGGETDTRGIWYRATGHDKIITLNILEATFDYRIGVYTGNCGSLQPVKCWLSGWHDNPSWAGFAGVDYTIIVMGYQRFDHVGTFDLDFYETKRPSNDNCNSAKPVESLPFFGNFDTRGAWVDTANNAGTPDNARGIWFTFVGGGGMMEFFLSSISFDADFHFYSGSCGNLSPIRIESWSSSSSTLRVPFDTIAGEQYFMLVTGEYAFEDVGTFGMEITGVQVLPMEEETPPVPVEDPSEDNPQDPIDDSSYDDPWDPSESLSDKDPHDSLEDPPRNNPQDLKGEGNTDGDNNLAGAPSQLSEDSSTTPGSSGAVLSLLVLAAMLLLE